MNCDNIYLMKMLIKTNIFQTRKRNVLTNHIHMWIIVKMDPIKTISCYCPKLQKPHVQSISCSMYILKIEIHPNFLKYSFVWLLEIDKQFFTCIKMIQHAFETVIKTFKLIVLSLRRSQPIQYIRYYNFHYFEKYL